MHRRFRAAAAGLTVAAAASMASGLARAAHPLITEDTGTQGEGNWQLELSHDSQVLNNSVANTLEREFRSVLSYGLHDTLDLMLGLPYVRISDRDEPDASARGWGDIELAAKWRFFDHGPLSIALRPGLELPTGDRSRGLSAERYVPSVFGILSYVPEPWGVHLHLGYTRNLHTGAPQRNHIGHASVAAQYSPTAALRLVADVSTETHTEYVSSAQVASAVLGAIYSPTPNVDLSFGYRRGLTDAAPDHSWLFGLTLRFGPGTASSPAPRDPARPAPP